MGFRQVFQMRSDLNTEFSVGTICSHTFGRMVMGDGVSSQITLNPGGLDVSTGSLIHIISVLYC